MHRTTLYGARDVRFEERPDPQIVEPTDAKVGEGKAFPFVHLACFVFKIENYTGPTQLPDLPRLIL